MPRYKVKKFCEAISEIIVEATDEEAASWIASSMSSDKWTDWHPMEETEKVEWDFTERIEDEQE